jgi:hemerythrin-like metal-binding protein
MTKTDGRRTALQIGPATRTHQGLLNTFEEMNMATATALLFPWSDTYSVKIGIIDMQHKNLVSIINELHQAMVAGHGKEQLGKILSNLINYTHVHFKTEETFMESHQYPEFTSHKSEHDRLTKTVLDFQAKFQRNEVGLTIEVMDFLKNWLGKHILGVDKRYAPFFNAKGMR